MTDSLFSAWILELLINPGVIIALVSFWLVGYIASLVRATFR